MTSGVVGVLAEALAQHGQTVGAGGVRLCFCGEWRSSPADVHKNSLMSHAEHLASVVGALPNIAVIEVPTDITPEPEDNTWFRVRGFDYYGGTDEDMPIDQIEAQAADILAISRYRRAAAGGNVNG